MNFPIKAHGSTNYNQGSLAMRSLECVRVLGIIASIAKFALALKITGAVARASRWPVLASTCRIIPLDFLTALRAPRQDTFGAHVRFAHKHVELKLLIALLEGGAFLRHSAQVLNRSCIGERNHGA